MTSHILRRKADRLIKLWCPYCDKVVNYGSQDYFDDVWCTECKRIFDRDPRFHKWPKGFDIKTGELKQKKELGNERNYNK
jgi:hypothetical protein